MNQIQSEGTTLVLGCRVSTTGVVVIMVGEQEST